MENSYKFIGGCLLVILAVIVGIGVAIVLPAYIISGVLNNSFSIFINTWNVSFLLIALYIIFCVIGSFFKGGNKVG